MPSTALLQLIAFTHVLAAEATRYLPGDAFEDTEDKLRRPLATLRAERVETEAELTRLELQRLADNGPDAIRCTRFSDLEPTESVWLERRNGATQLHGVMASPRSVVVLRPRDVKPDVFARTLSLLEVGISTLPRDKTSHPGLRPTDVYVVGDAVHILIEERVANRYLWTRVRSGEKHTEQLEAACRGLFREADFPIRLWKP